MMDNAGKYQNQEIKAKLAKFDCSYLNVFEKLKNLYNSVWQFFNSR